MLAHQQEDNGKSTQGILIPSYVVSSEFALRLIQFIFPVIWLLFAVFEFCLTFVRWT